jgi:6-phosphogluconolactonase
MMEFIVNYKNIIEIFNNTDELSEFIGNYWKQKIDDLDDGKYYSIALSGGNTPIKIFKYLSENFKDKIVWNEIRFFWGDERCVPPSKNDSNYKLAYDYLFSKIDLHESNIFRIKGEDNQ